GVQTCALPILVAASVRRSPSNSSASSPMSSGPLSVLRVRQSMPVTSPSRIRSVRPVSPCLRSCMWHWAFPVRSSTRPACRRRRRSEEHTSELQSRFDLVCRLLLEKKKLKLQQICTKHDNQQIA